MPLSREEVLHIAALCRIALTEEEVGRFQTQLSNILKQVDVLKELDTTAVPPTGHSVTLSTVFREDVSEDSFPQEQVLANAPRQEGDFFRVLRVLEES